MFGAGWACLLLSSVGSQKRESCIIPGKPVTFDFLGDLLLTMLEQKTLQCAPEKQIEFN